MEDYKDVNKRKPETRYQFIRRYARELKKSGYSREDSRDTMERLLGQSRSINLAASIGFVLGAVESALLNRSEHSIFVDLYVGSIGAAMSTIFLSPFLHNFIYDIRHKRRCKEVIKK